MQYFSNALSNNFQAFLRNRVMSSQNLSAGLTGKLEQHQILSQNLMRSLELLAMPIAELNAAINDELEHNPMLENVSDLPAADLPANENDKPSTEDENDYENHNSVSDEWMNDLPLPDSSKDDDLPDFISSLPAPPPQLRSLLLGELQTMEVPESTRAIITELITSLNDDGYLATPLADIAMRCDCSMEEASDALQILQEIAPPGIGARDLGECLKLQLIRQNKLTPEMEKLLDEGLDLLENNLFEKLEKLLDVTPDRLDTMRHTLRALNPFPGRQFTPVSAGELVIPEVIIARQDDGSYKVILRKDIIRQPQLSPIYEKMQDNPSLSDEDRQFFAEKLSRAKELIKFLENRGNTLQKLGEFIVEKQKDFLDHGVKELHPLSMKEAAAALDLSESTISRAVSGKYAATPLGTIPLKSFFPGGGSQDLANQALIEKIRDMIENENPSFPLSDDEIAAQLKKSGIAIARRTVAKYRDILHIPSSSKRKRR